MSLQTIIYNPVEWSVATLGEQEVGHGGEEGECPADEGDQADPGQVGEREDVERSGDGLVALHREGEDSED